MRMNATVVRTTPTTCDRNDGGTWFRATTVSYCVSLTEISVRVAIVTVLAVVALVATGWRRSAPEYPRQVTRRHAPASAQSSEPAAESGNRYGWSAARKVLDIVGLGSIATFVGILVALVVSTSIAVMVTALLNRL